jgi:hypothetical protein
MKEKMGEGKIQDTFVLVGKRAAELQTAVPVILFRINTRRHKEVFCHLSS